MSTSKRFQRLLEPGQIGKLVTKNRIRFAPTCSHFCSEDGKVTEREVAFIEGRAKGGAGIVTAGVASIDPTSRIPLVLNAADDQVIPEFRKYVEVIHKHNAFAFAQVGHFGRYAEPNIGRGPVGPSAITSPVRRWGTCRELSNEEVKEAIKAHVEGMWRAKEAGFDGGDAIGIAGYLVASFFSPWSNKRTDEYGGSLENRARIGVEIVDGIKLKCGKDFPLIFRVCGDELMEEGNSHEELRKIAKMLEEAGADAISVGVAWHESRVSSLGMEIPEGYWLHLAEGMKKVLKVPVLMAYRVNDPYVAERAIEEGKLDFWEPCRQLLADPEVPRKLAENRPEDITPCVACNQGCFSRVWNYQPLWCLVNPRLGQEHNEAYQVKPATVKKRVIMVGGGVAGMQAAALAAERGHDVTLYEKELALGGQVRLAAQTPYRGKMGELFTYLSRQIRKHGVKVELGVEVTPELIREKKPDALVIATGSSSSVPNVPGVEGENVVMVDDVLSAKVVTGQRVVVWGGTQRGIQTAELLHAQGKWVTIVEEANKIGRDIVTTEVMGFRRRLREAKINALTESKIVSISDKEVTVVDKEGTERLIPADTVVLTTHRKPDTELWEAMKGEVAEIYKAGDCVAPRKVRAAIQEGFRVGIEI